MMTDSERVRSLLTDIGPAMDLAGVSEMADGGPWALGDQDGTVIHVEHMAEDDRLWLSADVGTPRAEDRLRLYELILLYNAQWQQTGGVRIALDSPDGRIVQAYDVAASGLDVTRLRTLLGNFRRTLDGWRTIVAGERAPDMDFPAMPGPGVIRG
jgi:hypothetical protein